MLLSNFNLLATAPGGVARLRELILTLAVQGKLVPQDPSDEPASVLLQKIRVEKDRLIAEGKIRRDKPLAAIADEEKPFELPVGWEWERFGEIAGIERGGSPRPIQSFLTNDPDGLNWIKIGDTEKGGKYITSSSEKIRREGLSKTRMVFPGDFLLTNSMSFGRPYITQIEGCIHDGWLRISPPSSLNKDFLYVLLSSRFIRTVFEAAAAGGVVLNLNADKVRTVPIPLPPLAEQSRIVARVEELMRACDALEAKGKLEAAQHIQLVSTLLGTLANSDTPETLAQNWQRIAIHFDLLLDRPQAIDALEQTILQLAVRGLLSTQLAEDGHVEIGDRESSPIQHLPPSWSNVRFGDVLQELRYGTSVKCGYEVVGKPVLRIPNLRGGHIDIRDLKFGILEKRELENLRLERGDLLIVRSNGSASLVGSTALVRAESEGFAFAGYLVRARLKRDHVEPEYVVLVMQTIDVRQQIEAPIRTTSGVKNINSTEISRLSFALPPLAEQFRIVARVEELRHLCADLRLRMSASQTTQAHLAEALVESAAG